MRTSRESLLLPFRSTFRNASIRDAEISMGDGSLLDESEKLERRSIM
jgi:hypothetical protein